MASVPRYARNMLWVDLYEFERSAARVLLYDQVGWDAGQARHEIRYTRWDDLSHDHADSVLTVP